MINKLHIYKMDRAHKHLPEGQNKVNMVLSENAFSWAILSFTGTVDAMYSLTG